MTATLAGLGILLWTHAPELPNLPPHLAWPVLAVLFTLSERFAVHLPLGKETHSLAFSEAPIVLGLFFSTTNDLVVGRLVGAGLALLLLNRGRTGLIKVAFNLANFA